MLNNILRQRTLLKTHIRKIQRNYISDKEIIENIKKTKISLPSPSFFELFICGVLSPITFITFPSHFISVKENHSAICTLFGKYIGHKTTGLTWIPFPCKVREYYRGNITSKFTKMHLTDSISNPIIIDSFIVYNINNPLNFALNLYDYDDKENDLLDNWFEDNIRQIVSLYSYDELTKNNKKTEIINKVIDKINNDSKANEFGIKINQFGLLQINYTPEIAHNMLLKQKALITIESRKQLIEANVSLIKDVCQQLHNELNCDTTRTIASGLSLAIIGTQQPTNVLNIN